MYHTGLHQNKAKNDIYSITVLSQSKGNFSEMLINKTSTSALLTTRKPMIVWITTNCGKFFKWWEYQTTLPAFEKPVCRSRSNSSNQTQKNGLVQTGKRVGQGCILSSCLFNLNAEYIMWKARLHKVQAEIKIAGKNISNLRYADGTTLMKRN